MASNPPRYGERVECPRHPQSQKALSFCFSCRVSFCFSCLRQPETSHFGHNTQLLADAFRSCATQLESAQTLIDVVTKANLADRSSWDGRGEAVAGQLWEALQQVDSHFDELQKLIEETRVAVHFRLFNSAQQAQNLLDRQNFQPDATYMREVKKLERTVKASEAQSEKETLQDFSSVTTAMQVVRDERNRVGPQKGGETLPVDGRATLSDVLRKSSAAFESAGNDLVLAVTSVKFEKPVGLVNLMQVDRFSRAELASSECAEKLYVVGIAQADTPDSIYFTDSYNGIVKRLDLNTRIMKEVVFL